MSELIVCMYASRGRRVEERARERRTQELIITASHQVNHRCKQHWGDQVKVGLLTKTEENSHSK